MIFNELIYGDTELLDQIIPLDGGALHELPPCRGGSWQSCCSVVFCWLQRKFVAAPNPVESYAWLLMALWTVFPGSLSVTSQMYVYSFWPIYSYFVAKRLWSWTVGHDLPPRPGGGEVFVKRRVA